jgi:hypothetical protein
MPMPVSATNEMEVELLGPDGRHAADRDDDFPLCGELDRVANEIDQNLPQARDVAEDHGRHARIDEHGQIEILLVGAGSEELHRFIDALAEVEGMRLEPDLARLDLREIQDVVDDREQVLSGAANDLGTLELLVVERGVE